MTLDKIVEEMKTRINQLYSMEEKMQQKRWQLRFKYNNLSDEEINRLPMSHSFNVKDCELLKKINKVNSERTTLHDMLYNSAK